MIDATRSRWSRAVRATTRRRVLGAAAVVVVAGAGVPVAVHLARGEDVVSVSTGSPCAGVSLQKVGTVIRGSGRAGRPVDLRLRHLRWRPDANAPIDTVEILVGDRDLSFGRDMSDPANPGVYARERLTTLPTAADISFVPPAAGTYKVYVSVASACQSGVVTIGATAGSVTVTR